MSWNKPGGDNGNGNGKQPWGNKEGPPDLDELIRQLQRKVARMFGGGQGGTNVRSFSTKQSGIFGFGVIAIILALVYIGSGIFIVQQPEKAVIKRFGKYVRTVDPGPHWIPRFIETKTVLNIEEVKSSEHGGQMLTMDENIVNAKVAVQYRIVAPQDYLFNLVDPEETIQKVTESALRTVVGQSTLDDVLTSGRAEIAHKVRVAVENLLDAYGAGLIVSDLAMQQTKAPEEVKAAFDDAIKAQQDEEAEVNKAEAYSRQRVPIAHGRAKRIRQEAQAYQEQVILHAEGNTVKFAKLLPEYKRQPTVTRDRLFLDTFQEVYSKTTKIIVDLDGGSNLLYLPLDKIMNRSAFSIPSADVANAGRDFVSSTQYNRKQATRPTSRPSYQDYNKYSRSRRGA